MVDRGAILDATFREVVGALAGVRAGNRELGGLDPAIARTLARAQFASRHLDLAARALRRSQQGFFTIGSSGHEGNVAVAHASRPTDPAFLHYRSGAFFIERARQAGHPHALRDILRGMCAARSEPIAGGRYKIFGSVALAAPPQTSTIGSHLPKAVGAAVALGLRTTPTAATLAAPDDAIFICSFGDATVLHSTAQGALGSAAYLAFQGQPVPVLFVCEDNGVGISVPTAPGWIAASMAARPAIRYVAADGLDLPAAAAAARAAVDHVRATRRPAFLHLSCVRLLGHAGSDAELGYHTERQIRAAEERDPLLATARLLVESGAATAAEVLADYEELRAEIAALAGEAAREPRLRDAADVMGPIAPRVPAPPIAPATQAARADLWGTLPEEEGPLPLAAHLNRALGDLALAVPEMLVFGQDVGKKGGVYGVTRRLQRRLGPSRVLDSHLDEQWILGLAIGAGLLGMLPVAEIQYLGFLHSAEDQLRGEAATMQFFSQSQFRNPMIVRIPAYGFQQGFGGHFHNDNSIAVLRDLPGVIIASPSRGGDAAAMLRACAATARSNGSVCVFLEPIALYFSADLHDPGDDLWLDRYDPAATAELGRARGYGDGRDLLVVSFANGVPMSLRVARRLAREGIQCRVLDLRWLAPLPAEDLRAAAADAAAVLLVDETRATGGVGEALVTLLHEAGVRVPIARVASKDSFIPLGPAALHVLCSEADIEQAARALLRRPGT